MSIPEEPSSGVQQLIERLHAEGVARGQEEAEAVMTAARQEARRILDSARQEADALLADARAEAERTRLSGEEAVRLAGRDAILLLTDELRNDFIRKLRGLIGHCLEDTEFLRELIIGIARQSVTDVGSGPLHIQVFAGAGSDHETAQRNDALDEFIRSLSGQALREGLTFSVGAHDTPGVRVQVIDEELEIDLTTDTLTDVLLKQLSPRFREILQEK